MGFFFHCWIYKMYKVQHLFSLFIYLFILSIILFIYLFILYFQLTNL